MPPQAASRTGRETGYAIERECLFERDSIRSIIRKQYSGPAFCILRRKVLSFSRRCTTVRQLGIMTVVFMKRVLFRPLRQRVFSGPQPIIIDILQPLLVTGLMSVFFAVNFV